MLLLKQHDEIMIVTCSKLILNAIIYSCLIAIASMHKLMITPCPKLCLD